MAQAHPDNGAVFSQELHHVGHGAHRRQIGIFQEKVPVILLTAQGHDQLQGHAHTGQILEGIGAVLAMGVHHGQGLGDLLLALVVVGDDKVDTLLPGIFHLMDGGDAAVHGDDQIHTLLGQMVHGPTVDAVALVQAVGDVIDHMPPLAAQIVGQQTGGGDTVHVVVAVDSDLLPMGQGLPDAGDRHVHVLHEERFLELLFTAGEQFVGLLHGSYAPGAEGGGHQDGNPTLSHGFIWLFRPCRNVPLLILHGMVPRFGKNFCQKLRPVFGGRKEK